MGEGGGVAEPARTEDPYGKRFAEVAGVPEVVEEPQEAMGRRALRSANFYNGCSCNGGCAEVARRFWKFWRMLGVAGGVVLTPKGAGGRCGGLASACKQSEFKFKLDKVNNCARLSGSIMPYGIVLYCCCCHHNISMHANPRACGHFYSIPYDKYF